jgi:hypothetical protein
MIRVLEYDYRFRSGAWVLNELNEIPTVCNNRAKISRQFIPQENQVPPMLS